MGTSHSPVDIAKAAMEHAEKNGNNVVILDTAGRLHIDEGMMEELQKIKQAVTVHQTLLVVDAMTGQDAVNVASRFYMLVWERSFPIWNSFIPTVWRAEFWEWAMCSP